MAERIDTLKQLDVFSDIPDALLTEAAGQMKKESFAAGESIFLEGDVGDKAYFILEGELRLESAGITLIRRGAGDCIGEFSLVDGGVRSASAIAERDTLTLSWHKDDFYQSLSDSPRITLGIFRVLAKKLREDVGIQARAMQELETARRLQVSLMPFHTPDVSHLALAGRCEPAEHACGDFYHYHRRDDRLLICLADVTGHAMQAAIPAVLFSGLLSAHLEHFDELGSLVHSLNKSIHERLEPRTFICLLALEIDLTGSTVRLANAGCPYPCHFAAANGATTEIEIDAYPLGVRPETTYAVVEHEWAPGDTLAMFTDGIPERSGQGEVFGYERAIASIATSAGNREGSAQAVVDSLFEDVERFAAGPAEDDQTIVAVRWPASA